EDLEFLEQRVGGLDRAGHALPPIPEGEEVGPDDQGGGQEETTSRAGSSRGGVGGSGRGQGRERREERAGIRGLSDARAGALLRVTDVTIYHWRSAKKIPSDANRRKIEVFTRTLDPRGELRPGISPASWDEGREEVSVSLVEPFDGDAAAAPPSVH